MKQDTNYYQNGEDLTFKMISHEAERELFRKAKKGDVEAREFLIRNHLLFVARYGTKKAKGMLRNDEVTSALNEALMVAIDRFDPEYKNRFTRFLLPFLHGAMARLWRSKNPVDVPPPDARADYEKTNELFSPILEKETPDSPGRYGNDDSQTILAHKHREARSALGIEDPSPGPDEEAGDSDHKAHLAGLLDEFRGQFTELENTILDLMYREGVNRAEVARRVGKSREWIRVRHDELIKKLRRLYRSKGVTVA